MALDADDEILQDFLIEAGEIIEKLSEELVELEQRPDDSDLLNAIFRGFHTVKGGAGFLQLDALVNCCHSAENVFDTLRNHKRKVDSDLMDVVLEALDNVNSMFGQVRNQEEPTSAPDELIKALDKLAVPASEDEAASDDSASGHQGQRLRPVAQNIMCRELADGGGLAASGRAYQCVDAAFISPLAPGCFQPGDKKLQAMLPAIFQPALTMTTSQTGRQFCPQTKLLKPFRQTLLDRTCPRLGSRLTALRAHHIPQRADFHAHLGQLSGIDFFRELIGAFCAELRIGPGELISGGRPWLIRFVLLRLTIPYVPDTIPGAVQFGLKLAVLIGLKFGEARSVGGLCRCIAKTLTRHIFVIIQSANNFDAAIHPTVGEDHRVFPHLIPHLAERFSHTLGKKPFYFHDELSSRVSDVRRRPLGEPPPLLTNGCHNRYLFVIRHFLIRQHMQALDAVACKTRPRVAGA